MNGMCDVYLFHFDNRVITTIAAKIWATMNVRPDINIRIFISFVIINDYTVFVIKVKDYFNLSSSQVLAKRRYKLTIPCAYTEGRKWRTRSQ